MATLILEFADDEGMDELSRTSAKDPRSYNWREDNELLGDKDPALMIKIEKQIIQAGINPNGAWTGRKRAAYFAMVTQEYSILGNTKPETAKILEIEY